MEGLWIRRDMARLRNIDDAEERRDANASVCRPRLRPWRYEDVLSQGCTAIGRRLECELDVRLELRSGSVMKTKWTRAGPPGPSAGRPRPRLSCSTRASPPSPARPPPPPRPS